jgi:hypothetical protein
MGKNVIPNYTSLDCVCVDTNNGVYQHPTRDGSDACNLLPRWIGKFPIRWVNELNKFQIGLGAALAPGFSIC